MRCRRTWDQDRVGRRLLWHGAVVRRCQRRGGDGPRGRRRGCDGWARCRARPKSNARGRSDEPERPARTNAPTGRCGFGCHGVSLLGRHLTWHRWYTSHTLRPSTGLGFPVPGTCRPRGRSQVEPARGRDYVEAGIGARPRYLKCVRSAPECRDARVEHGSGRRDGRSDWRRPGRRAVAAHALASISTTVATTKVSARVTVHLVGAVTGCRTGESARLAPTPPADFGRCRVRRWHQRPVAAR